MAQETNNVPLIGDRPTQTASSYVIPKGYFQLEDGFVYETDINETKNITYSSMLLRYGLFENLELRFTNEYSKTKNEGFSDISGLSPFSVGTKIHVNEEKGWIPEIAFLAHISVAKTGSKNFMQNFHSTHMAVAFNNTINDLLSIGYSMGVEFPSEINYSIGTYSVVTGFAFSDKLGGFVEVYGNFSKYLYADNKINGGISYLIHPNFQLDFAGGLGLSKYSADSYFGFGLVYLFKLGQ